MGLPVLNESSAQVALKVPCFTKVLVLLFQSLQFQLSMTSENMKEIEHKCKKHTTLPIKCLIIHKTHVLQQVSVQEKQICFTCTVMYTKVYMKLDQT